MADSHANQASQKRESVLSFLKYLSKTYYIKLFLSYWCFESPIMMGWGKGFECLGATRTTQKDKNNLLLLWMSSMWLTQKIREMFWYTIVLKPKESD